MELQCKQISLTDGLPSVFYSHPQDDPLKNEGYKAFIDPNEGELISIHEISGGKNHGLSVHWNKGYAVRLTFYIQGKEAYRYDFLSPLKRRNKRTQGSVEITWDESVVNDHVVPDKTGKMLLDYDKDILRPAIEEIGIMLQKRGHELRSKASEVLNFEDYLSS